ncbi:hypothetical protein DFAR_2230012 [Desulfarculales bacterium]
MDEPAADNNSKETVRLASLVRCLRDEMRLTVLFIEHDRHLVMILCEQITVRDYGKVISRGEPAQV